MRLLYRLFEGVLGMRGLVAGVLGLAVWLVGAQGAVAQLPTVGYVDPPWPGFVEVSGSPFATGSSPQSVAFSPSGALVATANLGANDVSVFSVSSSGSLTPVSGSPFRAGNAPVSVAFSPSGGLVAVANRGDNTVSVFSVSPSGSLIAVSGSPFPTGSAPVSVAFSPSGGLVAVANRDASTVSVFSVSSSGSLTPVAGSPFAAGTGPDSVAFSPDGALAAVANGGDNTVSVFSVSSSGSLTPVSGLSGPPFATGAGPDSVAFSQYSYQGKGSPPAALAVANGAGNSVSMFDVDEQLDTNYGPADALVPAQGSPFAAGVAPASVAFSRALFVVAVADRGDNTVSVFSVNPSEGDMPGSLSPMAGSPVRGSAASGPASVAFSPSGGLLATANAATNNVSVFSVVDCTAQYNQGFDGGINSGYLAGFNAGWNAEYRPHGAWQAGYKSGLQATRRRLRMVRALGESPRIAAPAALPHRQRDAAAAPTGCDAVFNSAFDQGVSESFNYSNGFNSGWKSAYKPAFKQGFRAGLAKPGRGRNGTNVPLTGASTGVATLDTVTDPSPETSTFSGHLSHVGAFTLTGVLSFTPLGPPPSIPFTVTGTETLAAASGDEIFGAVSGTGTATPGHSHGTSLVTITGGTGRFSDASGSYTETSSLVVTFNGSIAKGKGTLTIQGRISY